MSRTVAARADDLFQIIGPYFLIGLLLITWEMTARAKLIDPFLLPVFTDVLWRIITDLISGELARGVFFTMARTLISFAIASVVGIAIGVGISRIRFLKWFMDPIVFIGLPMPKIALLPVFMIWFGLFDSSKIAMTAFSASFQIIVTVWMGADSVQKELIWSARSLGAKPHLIPLEIIIPATLPRILTALQIALPICLIVELVTEFVMGGTGLGAIMLQASRNADSLGVFAGIFEIGLLGILLIRTLEIVRRRLLVWHQEESKPE